MNQQAVSTGAAVTGDMSAVVVSADMAGVVEVAAMVGAVVDGTYDGGEVWWSMCGGSLARSQERYADLRLWFQLRPDDGR